MRDESTVLQQARQLDEDALAKIYDAYSPALYRYAMRLLGDVDLAEECVAETFSKLLHALHRGGGPTRYLQAYLFRIVHNWATDYYRRQPQPALPLDPTLPNTSDPTPSQALERELELAEVRTVITHLTPDQSQVVVLKFIEGWENGRISLALGKSIGAVKALQHRALESLKKRLLTEEECAHEPTRQS